VRILLSATIAATCVATPLRDKLQRKLHRADIRTLNWLRLVKIQALVSSIPSKSGHNNYENCELINRKTSNESFLT
jgi:hypothetical protein